MPLLPPLARIPPEIASLADYEPLARARLDDQAWAYLAGGSGDEITLRRNREAFDRLCLAGRVLTDLSEGDTQAVLFGHTFEAPIFLAPVAYQKLAHPEGERATVLAASAMRAGAVVSTQASLTLEEIAQGAQTPLWFQLYIQSDRNFTGRLVRRAEAAGYRALVVTVDAAVNGIRNREQRASFRLPAGVEAANLQGMPPPVASTTTRSGLCGGLLSLAATWKDLAWLKSFTHLPVILKGVMHPDDARLALEHGVDGLIVSNHGGRTLDGLPASIEALPRVAEAVRGRVPILLDGGIRRGTDVLKSLALGASGVLIGRPYVFALAAAGAIGVAHVLRILRAELEVAMALTGRPTLSAIDRSVLWE